MVFLLNVSMSRYSFLTTPLISDYNPPILSKLPVKMTCLQVQSQCEAYTNLGMGVHNSAPDISRCLTSPLERVIVVPNLI
jgi:hypothetical protein